MEYTFIDEPIFIHGSPQLRIGTDCSGIEAPIQALRQLGIPHKHVWSSDIDKYCIQSIKANYEPEILFGDPSGPYPDGDITKRDISILPDIDLYVCGFPCQPFSHAGKRKGFEDKRGNVFWSCLEVIKTKQPAYFILENVKGLLWHDKEKKKDKYGRTWTIIWDALQGLEQYGYTVKWKILNTKDFGIPQNRERVYIVGIKGKDFNWLDKVDKVDMDELLNYIDFTDIKKRNCPDYGIKLMESSPINSIINLGFRHRKYKQDICPCICASSACMLWINFRSRFCNTQELLWLQGFGSFNQNISETQLKKQIGNSMSVNVVQSILKHIL